MTDRYTLSIKDARRALGLGRTTIYKLIGDGTLQTITVGRRRLILTRSIQELCDQSQPVPQSNDASPMRANQHH